MSGSHCRWRCGGGWSRPASTRRATHPAQSADLGLGHASCDAVMTTSRSCRSTPLRLAFSFPDDGGSLEVAGEVALIERLRMARPIAPPACDFDALPVAVAERLRTFLKDA